MIYKNILALLLAGKCIFGLAAAQEQKHVILISIDGLRPEFYNDKSWPTPNLQQLKKEGTSANQVVGVFPTVTYPSHTTITTGQPPGKHGVYYNAPFGAVKGRWYWEDSAIKVPTIWSAAKKAGLSTAAVMWPVTVGAPIDYNFPVRRADGDEKTDQLTTTKPFITPANLLDQMADATGAVLKATDFNYSKIDITIGQMASFIFKKYQPNLMGVHFIHADHSQHDHDVNAPEVRAAVATIDSMIGLLLETVKASGKEKQTTFIITGDHGFVNASQVFSPNVLLVQNGIINGDEWQAKFNAVGGSAFLHTRQPNDKVVVEKVKKLLNALPANQKKLFRIVEDKELRRIGANPEVSLALAMTKGAIANDGIGGKLVRSKPVKGAHGFYPDFKEIYTGFIAAGNGVKSGTVIPSLNMLDIAPVVAGFLNVSFQGADDKAINTFKKISNGAKK